MDFILYIVTRQLMLCNVDIFGLYIWPKPSLLQAVKGDSDQSCSDACAKHNMVGFTTVWNNENTFDFNRYVNPVTFLS